MVSALPTLFRGRPVLTALGLALLLGCPYESDVPLDPARALPVDERLLGRWEAAPDPSEEEPLGFRMLKFSDTELLAAFRKDDETAHLRLFVVEVAGKPILCAQWVDDPVREREWLFFGYDFSDDGDLAVRPVSDKVIKEKFTDPAALQAHLAEHIDDPELLEEPMRFVRLPEPETP